MVGKLQQLGKIFDRILDLMALIGMLILALQVISVSADVMMRYFFSRPIGGITSFNEWSLLYVTFLGIAWIQRKGENVNLDLIYIHFSPRMQGLVTVLGQLMGLAVAGILFWYGAKITLSYWDTNYTDYNKLRWFPLAYVMAVIPIGSLALAIQLLRELTASVPTLIDPKGRRREARKATDI